MPKRTPDLKRENLNLIDLEENSDNPGKRKNAAPRTKTFKGESTYDPYHDMMQNNLLDLLNSGCDGYSKPKLEESFVDLRAKKSNEWHFFEIKTDAQRCAFERH